MIIGWRFFLKNFLIIGANIGHLILDGRSVNFLFPHSNIFLLFSQLFDFSFMFLDFVDIDGFMEIPDFRKFAFPFFQGQGFLLNKLLLHFVKELFLTGQLFDLLCWPSVVDLPLLHFFLDLFKILEDLFLTLLFLLLLDPFPLLDLFLSGFSLSLLLLEPQFLDFLSVLLYRLWQFFLLLTIFFNLFWAFFPWLFQASCSFMLCL